MEEMSKDSPNFTGGLKLFKQKKGFEVKQEVLQTINEYAEGLNLYDKRFDDDSQCGGFHAFRALCLIKEPLGKLPEMPRNIIGVGGNPEPGMYLIIKIHPNLRDAAWAAAKHLRKTLKIGNDELSKE